jgi:uncharacterized SAM-binding protein YcdF (DUF218 family)
MKRWLAIGLAVVIFAVWVFGQFWLFVYPKSDPTTQSDLIVVLGGNQDRVRVRTALELGNQYPTSTLLMSVYPGDCARLTAGTKAKIVCFQPKPFTTQGEARYATAYAKAHGSKSMLVIVTADQLSRARIRFERCWKGTLAVHAVDAPLRSVLHQLPYENAAMAKALIWQRSC